MTAFIDLNADVGEGYGLDQELIPLVSSVNISCGAHAGSEQDIRKAIRIALTHQLSIGAHPSYPDREHWGRRSIMIAPEELRRSLTQQMQWLDAEVKQAGGKLHHIKPHGALYNDAVHNLSLAQLIASCVRDYNPELSLVGLAGGQLLTAGRQLGLHVIAEAFVDRRYQADASLVPRTHPRALITDKKEALEQALRLVHADPFKAVDGSELLIQADSLCVHGDSEHAVVFATDLRKYLLTKGVSIQACHKPGERQPRR